MSKSENTGKLTGRANAVVNTFVMDLDLEESIQRKMFRGNYEPVQTKWATDILKPGNRFVDIGASFGHYVSLASSIVGGTGLVFAFEPSPLAHDHLSRVLALNKISNVKLIGAAVGDQEGEIELQLPMNDVVHSPSVFESDPFFVPHRVPLIKLDSFAPLNDGTPIDFVKMDIEGSEPNVINGMRGLISKGMVRNMMVEFNSGWLRRNQGMTPQKLMDLITSLGFSVEKRTEMVISFERGGQREFELEDILFSWHP